MDVGRHIISMEEYLKDPCPVPSLSRSVIKDLLYKTQSHAYWNHPRLNPNYQEEKSEAKFDIGSAAHSLFLEGDDIVCVIDADDWRTKKAKEERDEAYANGKTPLLIKQYDDVQGIVAAAHSALGFSELNLGIKDGYSEITYIWKEGETYCRIRVDWISTDSSIILDYKTTGMLAEPEAYSRSIVANGLDIQDAFYRRGVNAVDGEKPTFIFMVQEITKPYQCSFIELDMQFQDMGEQKVKRGLHLWKQCMSTGIWPGYSERIYTVEPPSYALASWEMRKAVGE